MVDLVIDPGHGGSDYGARGEGSLVEKSLTLYIANKIKEYLDKKQISVILTRNDDRYVTLEERAKIANKNKARCFISIHINSSGVDSAEGTEVYTFTKGDEGERLATNVLDKIVSGVSLKNRGVKFANFTVLKETDMPAILVETCFISNSKEEALLEEDYFRDKIALSIANGFLRHIGREEISMGVDEDIVINSKTPIISPPTATKYQAFQWAQKKGATEEFIALAEIYWNSSIIECGVNPVVAYAQSAIETNLGIFNGVFKKEYKNPCGLRISNDINDENGGYAIFNNWTSGVEAHLDHLGLYAGGVIYPKRISRDPRHFPYLLGKAKYIEDLSGNWSPLDDYGIKVLELVKEIESSYSEKVIAPIKLDDNNDGNNYNDELVNDDDSVEGLKKEVSSIISDIEKLKSRTEELKIYINSVEGFLAQEKKLKDALNATNMSLQEKNKSYEQTIEDILDVISKLRSIVI